MLGLMQHYDAAIVPCSRMHLDMKLGLQVNAQMEALAACYFVAQRESHVVFQPGDTRFSKVESVLFVRPDLRQSACAIIKVL